MLLGEKLFSKSEQTSRICRHLKVGVRNSAPQREDTYNSMEDKRKMLTTIYLFLLFISSITPWHSNILSHFVEMGRLDIREIRDQTFIVLRRKFIFTICTSSAHHPFPLPQTPHSMPHISTNVHPANNIYPHIHPPNINISPHIYIHIYTQQ